MNQTKSFIRPADRIASFKPYFFASLIVKINELRAQGLDVIRIDMGSPDLAPADFIIDKLVESARRSDSHGYTPNGGTPSFRQAIASYYQRRFGVSLDVKKEVLGLIGSKEGLFNLSQVILNPGDLALIPDPGYPVYSAGSIIAGGVNYMMPLLSQNGYLPDLHSIPADILDQAKLMWINYPNNPTGAIAPFEFFEEVIAFGQQHQILIAHDAPYVDVCFNSYVAPSIMQVPGAKEVAVEFNSLSKTYNMAGWRLGMAVGNPEVISLLNTYKSQMDTSQFGPIFDAGTLALTSDQEWLSERNDIYLERRNLVVNGLRQAGFSVETPEAAIYVWAKLPLGLTDSLVFCDRMLVETGVSTTPGIVYGTFGEGYLRVSLGTDTARIREAIERIITWVKTIA